MSPAAERAFAPMVRHNLADVIAERIEELTRARIRRAGDRLPSIAEMARRFGVAAPTVREALKKLETLGVIEIRPGRGVYCRARRSITRG